ncbi:ALP1-like protein isoform X1 [Tanacetum coccineum]
MLEVVADQRLWIWHAYFGVPRANNDLNMLYGSPLFDDELADTAPECPFVVNEHTYRKGYYLADGIYPAWSTFIKTFPVARDEKSLKFKRVEEATRKDIERAFGVLQSRWRIIRQPARSDSTAEDCVCSLRVFVHYGTRIFIRKDYWNTVSYTTVESIMMNTMLRVRYGVSRSGRGETQLSAICTRLKYGGSLYGSLYSVIWSPIPEISVIYFA